MDKVKKFLLKLNKKDKKIFRSILIDIRDLELGKYDVKSLKGFKGCFRLRKGKIRIVFIKSNKKGIVLDIAHRKDVY